MTKRSHLDTAQLCEEERLGFAPFVMEAEGGFGATALAGLGAPTLDCCCCATCEPVGVLLLFRAAMLTLLLRCALA